jgi:hypothetical protein
MSAKVPGYNVDVGSGEPLEVGGWDAIDGLADDHKARDLHDQVEYASMYRQCFASDAGRFVLADLIDQFLKPDIVLATDQNGFGPGIREGQARSVKRILYMIEFANTGGGKPTGAGVVEPEEYK